MADTLSTLIRELGFAKRWKKEAEIDLKRANADILDIENLIMQALDSQGLRVSASNVGKVTLEERTYPQVEAWDQFGEFILENRWLHLLERRPAVLAYRELLQLGRPVPGVLPFTKRSITFKEV